MIASLSSCKIGMRTTPEKKARFAALAAAQEMTETALLALLVDHVLGAHPEPAQAAPRNADGPSSDRLTLRLRPGDRVRVEARAAARGMKPSTYLVALIHAHARGRAPLPLAELNQLKLAVSELSAVRRHLGQLVRDMSAGEAGVDSRLAKTVDDAMHGMDDVRRSVAELVRVNLISWEAGDA